MSRRKVGRQAGSGEESGVGRYQGQEGIGREKTSHRQMDKLEAFAICLIDDRGDGTIR